MRTKIVILVVALVLGGLAAVLAARYLTDARSEIVEKNEPVEVFVAQEDIPRGLSAEELIASEMIIIEKVPARYVAAGAVSSERALEGHVLAMPLSAGEQVTTGRFELPSTAGLAYSIPADYIALSVPVDEVKGVSGLLKPGDHVTLFAHFEAGPDGDALTKMLVNDTKVLAVGGTIRQSQDVTEETQADGGVLATSRTQDEKELNVRTVTIAVSPLIAEKIVFAEEEGEVWCALLPATGEEIEATSGRTLQTVFK